MDGDPRMNVKHKRNRKHPVTLFGRIGRWKFAYIYCDNIDIYLGLVYKGYIMAQGYREYSLLDGELSVHSVRHKKLVLSRNPYFGLLVNGISMNTAVTRHVIRNLDLIVLLGTVV